MTSEEDRAAMAQHLATCTDEQVHDTYRQAKRERQYVFKVMAIKELYRRGIGCWPQESRWRKDWEEDE
jgi:hypothetical protein